MTKFSNDIDLLKWEPVLFRDLAPPSQILCEGNDGVLSGTTFTSTGAAFTGQGVTAGQVIYLSDVGQSLDGCYEVVSVNSATQLTVSVLRSPDNDITIAPPAGSGLSYRICTYDPQAEEVAYSLLQYFNLSAVDENNVLENTVLNERSLRQASVYAILSAVFAGNACGKKDVNGYWEKSLRYQKLFHRVRSRVKLDIDTNGDELPENYGCGGVIRLRRL